MATFELASGGNTVVKALAPGVKIVQRSIDLYELGKNEVSASDAFDAADVIQLINVPKNTLVMNAGLVCHTVEGATLTLSLGDGDQTNGYVNAYDAEAAGGVATASARAYGPDGRFYTAADTIDLLIATVGAQTSHSAELTVWALMAQINQE